MTALLRSGASAQEEDEEAVDARADVQVMFKVQVGRYARPRTHADGWALQPVLLSVVA